MGINKRAIAKQAREAVLTFTTKMEAEGRTDAELRLKIKILRAVLLARQQARATAKMA